MAARVDQPGKWILKSITGMRSRPHCSNRQEISMLAEVPYSGWKKCCTIEPTKYLNNYLVLGDPDWCKIIPPSTIEPSNSVKLGTSHMGSYQVHVSEPYTPGYPLSAIHMQTS